MRAYETLLMDYPDGHRLSRDEWQWIVQHHFRCPNAKRGGLIGEYAKYTYLTQEGHAKMEISACHLQWPTSESGQSPSVGNGGSAQERCRGLGNAPSP